MTVYLVTFSISYFLCLWGEKYLKNNRNIKCAKFLLFLSVMIVAVVAGLRSNSVGSDTISYTTYYIEYGSRFHTLRDFMNFFTVFEPGFNLFSYIIGYVFNHSSHWFLFWCAIVIYGFTMMAFYFYRKNCSISVAWLLFLMINCTEALNITRHYMALALTAYAFTFAFRNNSKKFFVWTILAMTFHISAVMNFILYFIYKGLQKFNTWWYKLFIILGTGIVSLLFPYLFRLLSSVAFIETKAEGYLNFAQFSIQLNPLLIRIPFLVLLLINKRSFCRASLVKENEEKDKTDVFGEFCFLMIIIELLLSQLRGFGETFYRLVTYATVLKYVSYSKLINMSSFKINKAAKYVFTYAFIILVFWYWVVVLNSGHIYPYSSDVLGL